MFADYGVVAAVYINTVLYGDKTSNVYATEVSEEQWMVLSLYRTAYQQWAVSLQRTLCQDTLWTPAI